MMSEFQVKLNCKISFLIFVQSTLIICTLNHWFNISLVRLFKRILSFNGKRKSQIWERSHPAQSWTLLYQPLFSILLKVSDVACSCCYVLKKNEPFILVHTSEQKPEANWVQDALCQLLWQLTWGVPVLGNGIYLHTCVW